MNAIISVKNKAIQEIANNLNVPVYFNNNILPDNIHNLIRFGSTKYSKIKADVIWNPSTAIWRSANKRLCREQLKEAGIPVPLNGTDLFPCIGRPDKHTRGQKFLVCKTADDVRRARRRGCTYFSQFYPKRHEYRVHIGSGKILFLSEKIGGNHPYVWNHGKGYVFKALYRHDWREEVYEPALQAIEALGLDFGAVDVGADPIDSSQPKAVIFEVNSAPSLSPYGIEKYTKYFSKILKMY